LFTVAGVIGLAVTLLAMRSSAYRTLSQQYHPRAPGNAAASGAASFGSRVPVLSTQPEPAGSQ
jgi:hypothetical protein